MEHQVTSATITKDKRYQLKKLIYYSFVKHAENLRNIKILNQEAPDIFTILQHSLSQISLSDDRENDGWQKFHKNVIFSLGAFRSLLEK